MVAWPWSHDFAVLFITINNLLLFHNAFCILAFYMAFRVGGYNMDCVMSVFLSVPCLPLTPV